MSWAEIKKAINSDLSTPLNTLISNVKTSLDSTLSTIKTYASNASSYASTASTRALNTYNIVNNSTYGNSAIKTAVDEVSNKVFTDLNLPAGRTVDYTSSDTTITGKGAIIGVSPRPSNNGNLTVKIDTNAALIVSGTFVYGSTNSYASNVVCALPLYFNTECVISNNNNSGVYYVLL